MSTALKRLHAATGTIALFVALLAIVAAAAGAGYAAGQIGTNGIKNNAITTPKIKNKAVTDKKIKKNAVTSKKVKNGTLSAADLVAEEKQIAAVFSNGGEGDCIWQNAGATIPGLGNVTYRKDRFGVVRLTGTAQPVDGLGGDGSCDSADPGQIADDIAFMLPASHMPAKTQLFVGNGNGILIVGPAGVVSGPVTLPPGAVYVSGGEVLVLDGVTYDGAGSSVVLAKTKAKGQTDSRFLEALGLS
jgi:hypothetical protein